MAALSTVSTTTTLRPEVQAPHIVSQARKWVILAIVSLHFALLLLAQVELQGCSDLRVPPSSFALPQACIAQFVDVYSASAVVLGIPDISSDLSMGATGTCL